MNRVQSNLTGSRTEKNLYDALAGESKAHTKYHVYADSARQAGLPVMGDTLDDIAGQEKEHAELWMSYLGEMGTTLENLENAEAGEGYESRSMYPEYSRIAREEGFDEIADKFMQVGMVEADHGRELDRNIQMLRDDTMFNGTPDTRWSCTNCGYVHTGEAAPEVCPLCGYPRGYFRRL